MTANPEPEKKLRLRREPEPEPDGDGTAAPPPENYLSAMKPPKRQKRVSAWRISHHVIAWMIFILLGAGMWVLRYTDYVGNRHLDAMKQYGPMVLLAFHILILLKAFQDSVFQGILCLLVPGYSLVYMFFINDDFYARSVFAGLLVGIGEDSFLYYKDVMINVYEAINDWLASGG